MSVVEQERDSDMRGTLEDGSPAFYGKKRCFDGG